MLICDEVWAKCGHGPAVQAHDGGVGNPDMSSKRKRSLVHHASWLRACGDYADYDVVADSRVNGQVHAQLSDPAVEWMPSAI